MHVLLNQGGGPTSTHTPQPMRRTALANEDGRNTQLSKATSIWFKERGVVRGKQRWWALFSFVIWYQGRECSRNQAYYYYLFPDIIFAMGATMEVSSFISLYNSIDHQCLWVGLLMALYKHDTRWWKKGKWIIWPASFGCSMSSAAAAAAAARDSHVHECRAYDTISYVSTSTIPSSPRSPSVINRISRWWWLEIKKRQHCNSMLLMTP